MTNSSVSPIEELNAAIQSHNPFSNAAIVKAQSVWGRGFPDLPSLNAHASQKVLEIIKQVKTSQSSESKVATLTITADIGSGKTHIVSRLRRRLIGDSTALFVYANAAKYGDLNLVKYQFLQTLVEELARIGSEGVTQWQEVAAAIANASNPNSQKTPAATIVKNFDKAYANALKNNHNLIKRLTAQILKTKPDADAYIIRAILWTLSESYAPYAVEWLAGNELDQETAKAMGLPTNANKTAQNKEAEALGTLIKILRLVSDHKPALICFDELEADRFDDYGRTTAMVIARLVKELYDNLEQSDIGQGIVIVTVMFQATWIEQISSSVAGGDAEMGGGVVDRISTATKAKPISLDPLNSQSTVDLVALWLREELYEPRNLKPHDPVYPFAESQLREIGKGKPTGREILDWCAKNFKIDVPLASPAERFELALKEANNSDIGNYLDNNVLIADALRFGFENLIGQTLEGVTSTGEKLKQVTIERVEPIGDWLNFKVSGSENNKKFTIGVAVLQQKVASSVKAGLMRLTDYKKFGITRGCLVRSKDKKINKNAQAYKFLQQLTEKLGGEWAYLEAEHIRPLIDLHAVYQNCQTYQLNEDEVKEFSNTQISENPLLREILSDPSGELDSETIQEDEMFGTLFEESSTNDTADNNELSNLFA